MRSGPLIFQVPTDSELALFVEFLQLLSARIIGLCPFPARLRNVGTSVKKPAFVILVFLAGGLPLINLLLASLIWTPLLEIWRHRLQVGVQLPVNRLCSGSSSQMNVETTTSQEIYTIFFLSTNGSCSTVCGPYTSSTSKCKMTMETTAKIGEPCA